MPQSRVRFIGSRELHRDLPKVLEALENPGARFVLTIHSKPKAVLIGAEEFLEIVRNPSAEDRLLALQLGALVQGLESSGSTAEIDERRKRWSASEAARIDRPSSPSLTEGDCRLPRGSGMTVSCDRTDARCDPSEADSVARSVARCACRSAAIAAVARSASRLRLC